MEKKPKLIVVVGGRSAPFYSRIGRADLLYITGQLAVSSLPLTGTPALVHARPPFVPPKAVPPSTSVARWHRARRQRVIRGLRRSLGRHCTTGSRLLSAAQAATPAVARAPRAALHRADPPASPQAGVAHLGAAQMALRDAAVNVRNIGRPGPLLTVCASPTRRTACPGPPHGYFSSPAPRIPSSMPISIGEWG